MGIYPDFLSPRHEEKGARNDRPLYPISELGCFVVAAVALFLVAVVAVQATVSGLHGGELVAHGDLAGRSPALWLLLARVESWRRTERGEEERIGGGAGSDMVEAKKGQT